MRPTRCGATKWEPRTALFGGRLALDSSLYILKWNNIQQSIRLPTCGFSFVDNLGSASGVGGDVSARLRLTSDLSAGVSGGQSSTDLRPAPFWKGPMRSWSTRAMRSAGRSSTSRPGRNTGFRCWAAMRSIASTTRTRTMPRRSIRRSSATIRLCHSCRPTVEVPLDATGTYAGGWEVSVFGNNLTNESVPLAHLARYSGLRARTICRPTGR